MIVCGGALGRALGGGLVFAVGLTAALLMLMSTGAVAVTTLALDSKINSHFTSVEAATSKNNQKCQNSFL